MRMKSACFWRRSPEANCELISKIRLSLRFLRLRFHAVSKFDMSETAVAVRGLTKTFKIPFKRERVIAVRDLTLEVEVGQVYGVLGPNGSGKSTTLKIILGLVRATRGTTEIFGRDSCLVASRNAVGFLPENPYFYKYLTGAPLRPWVSMESSAVCAEDNCKHASKNCLSWLA